MAQPLPSKENSLFRQVVQAYESKQYKKGIKAADQILKKHPNHGDTQAMKALILNSQGKTEEAFDLCKIALKNAMKSHVCWHVYGLLYRSAKNYEEATKAYKFALRLEPDSPQIQRDLALLQCQTRDYQGFIQSRKVQLQARPQLRQNWTAVAVAHHLAGELEAAEKVLTTYEGTLKNPPPRTDMEHHEACLYKNTIIAESGDYQRALDHLETIFKTNPDRTAVMEYKAQYLLKLDRKPEAEAAYRALLNRNSEKRAYYDGLEKSLGLDRNDPASHEKLAAMYQEYADKNERSDAPRRVPLDFLQGSAFREAADKYLRRVFQKGVPSTFANVKALYIDSEKLSTIQELVHGYEAENAANGAADANGDKPDLWKLALTYFLAQHYNYHLSRDLSKAMDYVNKAIEMRPEQNDYTYHYTKARIYKHQGDVAQASAAMNEARELDLKDRYINTKCAKYQLRNNENDKAIETMGLFTRKEAVGGPLGDLIDMQCMWYLYEDGEAWSRQGNLGLALKRFKTIYDIFDVWQEDQFDFHSFSIRKGQIRAYIDMIRWEDHLRQHPFYTRAALSAIKIYTMLFDRPELAQKGLVNGEGVSEADKKKAAKQARKEQERVEAEKKAAAAAKATATSTDGETKKEDLDPQGRQLTATKDPLGEAMKYLTPLLEQSPLNVNAQFAGYEVYSRRKLYLPALKCLLAVSKLDAGNADLRERTASFRKIIETLPEPLPAKIDEFVQAELKNLP
ncbi:hypothetical protein AAFC00_005577 [Neodothiora populina]|uniref:Uncharacterized protein n=1 Tax=Neodothiora populina TaxID=2781224 RepID=A0ABR3PMG0_9PEZI